VVVVAQIKLDIPNLEFNSMQIFDLPRIFMAKCKIKSLRELFPKASVF